MEKASGLLSENNARVLLKVILVILWYMNVYTQLYRYPLSEDLLEEEKQKRIQRHTELDICLHINVNQPFVKKMVIFYEKEEDKTHYEGIIGDKLSKVLFVKHDKQAYYKDFLVHMRDTLPDGEVCCSLASDIYLNYDIEMDFFDMFLPVNTVFGITRHEPTNKEHTVCNDTTCVLAHSAGGCADCFIFRTPIPKNFNYEKVNHKQNRWGGECNFLHTWHQTGAKIYNPCYQVKTIHLHHNSIYFTQNPNKIAYGRPYLPSLEDSAPEDSNHCINRPCALYPPGEVVCFRCKAHQNIFCKWHNGGRDWTCNICEMYNKFEDREWARRRALESASKPEF